MKVYLSSTYEDLKDYRESVYRTLSKFERIQKIVAMEDYVACDERPVNKCLRDVEKCDAYIGLFAWRYGFIPDEYDDLSITNLEYLKAVKKNKPIFIFLVKDKTSWPNDFIDKSPDNIINFRNKLQNDRIVSFFKSKEDLSQEVSVAITNYINKKSPTTIKEYFLKILPKIIYVLALSVFFYILISLHTLFLTYNFFPVFIGKLNFNNNIVKILFVLVLFFLSQNIVNKKCKKLIKIIYKSRFKILLFVLLCPFFSVFQSSYLLGISIYEVLSFRVNSIGMYFVNIQGDFYLQSTEVTVNQWKKFKEIPKDFAEIFKNEKNYEEKPITYISWNDSKDFIDQLNSHEKKVNYWLPTCEEINDTLKKIKPKTITAHLWLNEIKDNNFIKVYESSYNNSCEELKFYEKDSQHDHIGFRIAMEDNSITNSYRSIISILFKIFS